MIQNEALKLIEEAYRVSKDTGLIVEQSLQAAINQPITKEEVEKLLTSIIDRVQSGASTRGDSEMAKTLALGTRQFIEQAMVARERIIHDAEGV